jgi:hypothetical protein
MRKRFQALLLKVREAVRRRVKKSPKAARREQANTAHAHGHHDIDLSKRNISRFFVEQRHITWVMLIGVCVWGVYSYKSMPQRKDPDTPVKTAVAITVWPGVDAEKIEQLVTRKIEEKVAQNANVEKIRSISRTSISVVYVDLDENFPGTQIGKEFRRTSRSNSTRSPICRTGRAHQVHQGLRRHHGPHAHRRQP